MPIHGAGILLTLDATIQQFAREALLSQFKEYKAEAAVAMVADPHTGEILAMVTLPDFEPTETGKTAKMHRRSSRTVADGRIRAGQHFQAVRRGHRSGHQSAQPI